MSFKTYKTRALHEMDIDWKIKNTLTSNKTDHKTGTTTYGKRWMSDQERVAKSNAIMTGVKMDADGLVPDAGAFVKGHLDKAINTTANMLDGHKGMRDKLANKFNVKNIDGATFKNMATNATKDTAFNINKNIPGTTAYRYQGVANSINSKNLKNSYEPEGEFLSYEEVEVFVESLSEQGYTEEQILLELDRKGFGSVVLGKGLELGMSAIKNTYKAGKAFRGVVNRGIKDTKLTKDILSTAKTLRQQPTTTSSSGGTLKNFMSRVKGKLNRTDIKTNTPTKAVNPQALGGAATTRVPVTKMKNVTPIGNRITAATNKIKAGGTTAAVTGGAVAGSKLTSSSPTKVTPAAVTNVTKKEVTPTKNPVVKKTSERGRSVDRAYGAQIAQTRKLRGDAAAEKQRNKFINRAITSKEMDEGVSDQFKPSLKDELLSSANKRHKKAKSFKQFKKDAQRSTLKKGEVRKLVNGKWVSNKKEEVEIVQEKSAAWQRKEGKNKKGGLNEKGRKSYERENPGSDLKAPQPEGGPRKRSFCARMGGVKGPMKKPNGEPTRKALALRKWKC